MNKSIIILIVVITLVLIITVIGLVIYTSKAKAESEAKQEQLLIAMKSQPATSGGWAGVVGQLITTGVGIYQQQNPQRK